MTYHIYLNSQVLSKWLRHTAQAEKNKLNVSEFEKSCCLVLVFILQFKSFSFYFNKDSSFLLKLMNSSVIQMYKKIFQVICVLLRMKRWCNKKFIHKIYIFYIYYLRHWAYHFNFYTFLFFSFTLTFTFFFFSFTSFFSLFSFLIHFNFFSFSFSTTLQFSQFIIYIFNNNINLYLHLL